MIVYQTHYANIAKSSILLVCYITELPSQGSFTGFLLGRPLSFCFQLLLVLVSGFDEKKSFMCTIISLANIV